MKRADCAESLVFCAVRFAFPALGSGFFAAIGGHLSAGMRVLSK
jgi:hypothetical protein